MFEFSLHRLSRWSKGQIPNAVLLFHVGGFAANMEQQQRRSTFDEDSCDRWSRIYRLNDNG